MHLKFKSDHFTFLNFATKFIDNVKQKSSFMVQKSKRSTDLKSVDQYGSFDNYKAIGSMKNFI